MAIPKGIKPIFLFFPLSTVLLPVPQILMYCGEGAAPFQPEWQ